MPARQPEVTPQQLEIVRNSLVKTAIACFTDNKSRRIHPYPHQRLIAFVLERPWLGHTVIVAPPEHAKSYWTGIFYCAWMLGHNPALHVTYISASEGLAVRTSKSLRAIITENTLYQTLFPAASPDYTKGWNERQWFLQRPSREDPNPSFFAVGAAGALLGARSDVMIFDDVNTEAQQRSPLMREQIREWCMNTALTRVDPEEGSEGRAIDIQTRWHEEDLAGYVIQAGWSYLHFKALADEGQTQTGTLSVTEEHLYHAVSTDLLKEGFRFTVAVEDEPGLEGPRRVWRFAIPLHSNGRPLWPEHVPEKKLLEHKLRMGPRAFACTYQGSPAPEEGNVIPVQKFQRYTHGTLPTDLHRVATWQTIDSAFTTKTSGDYSVIQTWTMFGNGDVYLVDQVRRRLAFPDLKAVVQAAFLKASTSQPVTLVRIEDKASGQSLIQEIQRDRGDFGRIPVEAVKVITDKVTRAYGVTGLIDAEKVYIPEGVDWADDFVKECALFPNAAHDDQVDAMVMGLMRAQEIHLGPSPVLNDPFDVRSEYIGPISRWEF